MPEPTVEQEYVQAITLLTSPEYVWSLDFAGIKLPLANVLRRDLSRYRVSLGMTLPDTYLLVKAILNHA